MEVFKKEDAYTIEDIFFATRLKGRVKRWKMYMMALPTCHLGTSQSAFK